MMKTVKKIFKFLFYTFCLLLILVLGRIIILVIGSYTHNYADKIWQPYQQGDTLVFVNNKGDTISKGIFEILNVSNPSDPLLLLNHRIYSTFVNTTSSSCMVNIDYEQGKKSIVFDPPFRRAQIYFYEDEDSYESLTYNQLSVLKLVSKRKDQIGDVYLQMIYWSPKFGYVKVLYSNGECWELKSMIRDGKVIYESSN